MIKDAERQAKSRVLPRLTSIHVSTNDERSDARMHNNDTSGEITQNSIQNHIISKKAPVRAKTLAL